MRADRRGMTLVELLIALSLTGLTVAVAVGISHAALTVDERLASEVVRYEATVVGEQLLAQLLTQGAASARVSLLFEGAADVVRFSSRCPTASGTATSCEVTLQLVDVGQSAQLRAEWSGNPGTTLAILARGARFSYLADDHSDAEAEPRWHAAWGRNAAVPRAVGVVVATDTLVYWVGPR